MIKLKTLITEALNISNVETELIALNNEYPQYGYGLGRYMGSGIPEDAYDFPGGNKKEADEFYDKAVDIVRQVSPNFGIIIWIMIVIACCLSATTTFMIDSRMDEMETNIDEINSMLKDMTD